MPELPDVEVFRQYCQSTSLHKKITDVTVQSERILDGVTEEGLEKYLKGHTFQGADRHGKYLFLDVDGKGWMGLHFGMTGNLKYYKNDHVIPEYTRALYDF
jgi:formamidopyrimidine-DNA glycosylase